MNKTEGSFKGNKNHGLRFYFKESSFKGEEKKLQNNTIITHCEKLCKSIYTLFKQ